MNPKQGFLDAQNVITHGVNTIRINRMYYFFFNIFFYLSFFKVDIVNYLLLEKIKYNHNYKKL